MSGPSNAIPSYWTQEPGDLATALGSSLQGLSSTGRAAKIAGAKKLQPKSGASPWPILWGQFKSPILLLLLGAACLSFFLRQPIDASVIVAIILASGALGFQHEFQASRAVAKLMQLVQTKTSVLIDGVQTSVASNEIVAGDLILVSAGSMLPGDAILVESTNLYVDQAALTGESFPVAKQAGATPGEAPVSARTNVLFAGSHVVSGYAKALVAASGLQTELGSIASTLRTQRPETEFEHGVRRFGILLIELTLLLTLGVFAVNIFRNQPPLESFLFALALAVGLTPQLLPAIVSVNLSRGAVEMAAKKVITKRLSAIENLGSMDVLCSDKTGTLTLGVVRLHEACGCEGVVSSEVLRYAQLNARLQTGFQNPIDDALASSTQAGFPVGAKSVGEVPYDFIRKRLSVAVLEGGQLTLVAKGALRQILAVCDTALLNGEEVPVDKVRQKVQDHYQDFSDQGYRVLGVATKRLSSTEAINADAEAHMRFEGFVVLEDPLRPEIAQTVGRLADLGVELKVITGDNRLVAARLATELGLSKTTVVTGEDLHHLTDAALFGQVSDIQVFAEIEPNQKERIVLALKKRGFVVGYIGDGINDGSALHAADAGISVANAVDVAKEAADFVMLEPGLDVLTNAVVEGRKTFANTMKYIFMATSANFGNMFSLAGASMLISFLPLLPKQVLLMNFITDIPEMTIASDTVDPEQLEKPQRWDIHLLRRFMIVFGILSSVFDFATFGLLLALRVPQSEFQTGWFVESVISACMIVLVIRSRRPFFTSKPSLSLLSATIGIVILTAALPFSPVAGPLGMSPLPAVLLLGIGGIVVLYITAAEITKHLFWRRELRLRPVAATLK